VLTKKPSDLRRHVLFSLGPLRLSPLDRAILEAATRYRVAHDLSPQDALVYAAVLSQLTQSGAPQNCFLTKNSKDFDDPDLVEELSTYNCRLLPRFDIGYQFILSRIS
jgi:hypothetical protein